MILRDLMTTKVKTITTDGALRDAAKIMRDVGTGAVPVVENDKPIGIITDRDIVIRSVPEGKDPDKAKVGDVMTKGVETMAPDANVHEAMKQMKKSQIRRLIVMADGELSGIVSLGDLAIYVQQDAEKGDALERISEPT